MLGEGRPSRREMYREKMQRENPVYPDRPLRDILGPPPSLGPERGPELRDNKGRMIRALAGSTFKGTF